MKMIDKLKMMHSLPQGEDILRQFILSGNDIIYKDKKELICELHISSSTIYRFCQKMGVKGYNELRLTLAQESLQNEKPDKASVDFDFPFQADDSLKTVCENMLILYEESVCQTFKHIDFAEFQKAVAYIQKAGKICIATTNTNTNILEKFASQLIEIGKNVKVSSSDYMLKQESVYLCENDVFILNSYAGLTSRTYINILPMMKKKHVPVILIGSTHNSSFMPYAACKLLIYDKEDPKKKIFGFSTSISTQYLLDAIYAAVYRENYDNNLKKRDYIYGVTAK